MPLREGSTWTKRYQEDMEIELLKRFYLIFEGDHTERRYFTGIENNRKELGINSNIDIVILSKEGELKGYSDPENILNLVRQKKDELMEEDKFDVDRDQFVIVIDRDSFDNELSFIEYAQKVLEANLLVITNPCFELWLILHRKDAIEDYILPNKDDIIKNTRVSANHTFISKLVSDIFCMNSKSRLNFNKLKEGVDLAIEQEKKLAQTYEEIASSIGSNVGLLIEKMREDPREKLF